jgi:hypothetical protein
MGDDTAIAIVHAARVGPTRYRIVVKGRLSDRFDSAFHGVVLEPLPGATALTGEFADETQLYGVLDRLRDFGIELVSVNAVGASEASS